MLHQDRFEKDWGAPAPRALRWFAALYDGQRIGGGEWKIDPERKTTAKAMFLRAVDPDDWQDLAGAVRLGTWRGQPVWFLMRAIEGVQRGAVVTRRGPWEPLEVVSLGLHAFAATIEDFDAWVLGEGSARIGDDSLIRSEGESWRFQ